MIQKLGSTPDKVTIFIYGQPGTGKTRFAATAALTKVPRFNVLFGSAEAGLLSLKKMQREVSALRGEDFEFDTWPIKSLEDLAAMKDHLYNAKHTYNVVVLDSGTEMQSILREAILEKKRKANAKNADEIAQKDWGVMLHQMVAIIRAFRDLPKVSFVLTCLSQEKMNEETGATSIMPMLDGKIAQLVDGYFDEVFYAFTHEREDDKGKKHLDYLLATRNTGKVRAKDRSGELAPIERPDFIKLFDKINGVKHEREPSPVSSSKAGDSSKAKGASQHSGSNGEEGRAQEAKGSSE